MGLKTGLRTHEKRLLEHLCLVRKFGENYEHFVEGKAGIRVIKTTDINEQESRKKIEIDVPEQKQYKNKKRDQENEETNMEDKDGD